MKKIFYLLSASIILLFQPVFGQDPFEPNNTFDNPALIICGQQFSAYIQEQGDLDWYQLIFFQPGVLKVEVTSVPDELDLNVAVYQIISDDPVLIADDRTGNSSHGQSMTAYALHGLGEYLILIEDEGGNGFSSSDAYEVSITCEANQLELNQIWEEAAPIPTDTCFGEKILGDNHLYDISNDVDWFMVEIPASGVLKTTITSVPSDLDLDVAVYKIESFDPVLIADDRTGNSSAGESLLCHTLLSPGTYYIRVHDEGDTQYSEDSYYFCVEFTANQLELNQTWEEAAPIPADTCFEARIYGDNHLYDPYNDIEWFEVDIETTGVLNISVTSVPSNLDLDLAIYRINDFDPELIADDRVGNSSTGESLFCHALLNPGTYYIKLHDEGDAAFNEETYQFCVDFTPNALELNQTWDEAAQIPYDTCFEANIYGDNHLYDPYNDVEWFEVVIDSSGVLEVAVTLVPDNLDLNVAVYQIVDFDLTLIADDRNGNASAGESIYCQAVVNPGAYFITVHDEGNSQYNEDPYHFCVDFAVHEYELNQNWEEAAMIPVDTSFQENIYGDNHLYSVFNDVDWFGINILEPGVLQLEITSVPDNIDLNLELYQMVENDLVLIADDGVGNASNGENMYLDAELTEAGIYFIKVEDEGNNAFNEDSYQFYCSFITPFIDEFPGASLLQIYPNPCNGNFTIDIKELPADIEIHRIDILDKNGREITTLTAATEFRDQFSIELKNSETGIYLIRIFTSEGLILKKLVVM